MRTKHAGNGCPKGPCPMGPLLWKVLESPARWGAAPDLFSASLGPLRGYYDLRPESTPGFWAKKINPFWDCIPN